MRYHCNPQLTESPCSSNGGAKTNIRTRAFAFNNPPKKSIRKQFLEDKERKAAEKKERQAKENAAAFEYLAKLKAPIEEEKRQKEKDRKARKKMIRRAKNSSDKLTHMGLSLMGKSYEVFLKSKYWKIVRLRVYKRDRFKCTNCGSKKEIQAHHKTYKHHFFEHNNLHDLTTLCKVCHEKEHLPP